MDDPLINTLSGFNDVLNEHLQHMKMFHQHEVQVEGWLKGELLVYFHHLQDNKAIHRFEREVILDNQRKKIDIRLEIRNTNPPDYYWIEIKHWLIGHQKGYKLNCNFYFTDPTSVGILPDVNKLSGIKADNKYLVILTTNNPGAEEWIQGINKFNTKFGPLHIDAINSPASFPQTHFLGVLKTI